MPDSRYVRAGRHPYNTKSHKTRAVKTPGGKLTGQIIKKTTKGPRCMDCKLALQGIKHMKGSAYRNSKKRERTVSRCYGGSACASCVKTRIVRAFLLEEQKAVKKVLDVRSAKK